ncbi:MAG: cysteine desulfurase [Bacteroidota bacterium]
MAHLSSTQLRQIEKIRQDFPVLSREVYGKPLVYFDNAATGQKPQVVLDRLQEYYAQENSNVHRGVHHLSQIATDAYEGTREKVRNLINAAHTHEIIYTSGTTAGINLLAQSLGMSYFKKGDEIIISAMEHHSNIVPWQMLCERLGTVLKVIPVNDKGELDLEAYQGLLSEKTALVSIVHTSNSLGTINPVSEMIQMAHAVEARVLVDAAQLVPHAQVDVQALDIDYLVFSGHKLFGPTGTGILYGKEKWLDSMPPVMGGGDMIKTVRFEKTTYNDLPHKFEAGTPHIAGFVGLGAAIDYVQEIGYDWIGQHEQDLLEYGTEQLRTHFPQVRIVGEAAQKASVISFLLGDIHPYDAGTILDRLGIAIRTGHHCTQPIMHQYGIPGTMRASFAFYNTREEIDQMIQALKKVESMFG